MSATFHSLLRPSVRAARPCFPPQQGPSTAYRIVRTSLAVTVGMGIGVAGLGQPSACAEDIFRSVQSAAISLDKSPVAHWGSNADKYTGWTTHSNRLIPVYTFGTKGGGAGVDLESYLGVNSPYRSEEPLQKLYGQVPEGTLNPSAEYGDQTQLAALQRAAFANGRKYVFLVVFDGMDWQTTRLASIAKLDRVAYSAGRGTGLHIQDETANGTTQFGAVVVNAWSNTAITDVNMQTAQISPTSLPGGYNAQLGGPNPWTPGTDNGYLIAKPEEKSAAHCIPDSSATATALCSGVKTYNSAVNVDHNGQQLRTVAHDAQQNGLSVGVVTSVPVSHATPASAYAHNVNRGDYQDLTRDLIGRPSISHPENPLPGVDVLIGCGWGVESKSGSGQGANFVPGNIYLTDQDREAVGDRNGGGYIVATRTAGQDGGTVLDQAASKAVEQGTRLLGYFGTGRYKGHLPFRTADGDYNPTVGVKNMAETYTPADLDENPTLQEMTAAALRVLQQNPRGFWLMVEAGDVDWANHDDNLDNSAGAVISGDDAVRTITDWVNAHSNWSESVMIVTADHGHYMFLDQPELLVSGDAAPPADSAPVKSTGSGK